METKVTIRLPAGLAQRVRQEAEAHNTTQEIIVDLALGLWFTLKDNRRAGQYRNRRPFKHNLLTS